MYPDEVLIEQYTRQEDGKWLFSEHRGPEATVVLAVVDCTFALKRIYPE